MLRRILFTLLTLATFAVPAWGQSPAPGLMNATRLARDLDLPTEPSYLGALSAPKLALYKPDGPGPFPALVVLHQCGGLRSATGTWQNLAVLGWAKEAVARGYVVLVLDSLGPRGVDSVCFGPNGGVNFPRGVRDAFQGAALLRTLPYVDPDKVGFVGFSWGAMVGVLASGHAWADALASGRKFQAIVAFYPGCFEIRPQNGRPYPVLGTDVDTPLLVLMGGLDNETPPADCISRLEPLKAAGANVDWHLYPDATHCWDCANLDRFRKRDFRGNEVEYRYHREAHKDAAERTFAFLARTFAEKR